MEETAKKESEEKKLKEKEQEKAPKLPAVPATQGLHGALQPKDMILNTKLPDSGSKSFFDNQILCAQFLRDYIDLPCLKNVRPEDIEDVSAQYVSLFAEERNSDRVKRVSVEGTEPFFLVSLIEHKTRPDYNVCMQVFRYMVYIWETYEREGEKLQKGVSRRADFCYPPILPIVYYEGRKHWSVPLDFRSRIRQGEAFGLYLPNFRYYLVPLRDYSNEELLDRADEISLLMLINKIQTSKDVAAFRSLPAGKVEAILQHTPGHVVDIIADILKAFLLKVNVSPEEAEELTGRVKEKKMAELFEDMEKMDIQEERRRTEEQRQKAQEQCRRAERAEEEAARTRKALSLAMDHSIEILVESYLELGAPREAAERAVVKKFGLGEGEAAAKVGHYWGKTACLFFPPGS